MMKHFVLIGFITFLQNRGSFATSCSKPERNQNPQQCIADIRSMVQDKDEFWFGTEYSRKCPGGPYSSLECSNTLPIKPDSLATRIFWDVGFNYSMIDRILTVEYTTEAGKTYHGCGQTWTTSSQPRTIDIEPLSRAVYHPLDTKLQPVMNWEKEQGELYTIMIYDAGSHISHGIFINYNEMEVVKPYSGPLNPNARPNVYAFLLFKQKDFINLTAEWRAKLANPFISTSYNMSDAIDDLGLEGPIAVNVVRVSADLYSVQTFVNRKILNNCAYFVTQALKQHNRTFIPSDVDLSVMMYVTFDVQPIAFGSCCKMYNYPQNKNMALNPIGNGRKRTDEVRTGLSISVQLVKRTVYPMATSFKGTLHSLLVVDPDVPNPASGTPDKPLLHWLVINIPDGLVSNGEEIKSYMGAVPPNKEDHTYYFLLFEQNATISKNVSEMYAGTNCSSSIAGRCLFDMSRFETGNSLRLVGASWFVATNDEYARHYWGKVPNSNIDELCKGISGYSPDCPTGSGNRHIPSFAGLYLFCVVILCSLI